MRKLFFGRPRSRTTRPVTSRPDRVVAVYGTVVRVQSTAY